MKVESEYIGMIISCCLGMLLLGWIQYRHHQKVYYLIHGLRIQNPCDDQFQTLFEAAPECIKLQSKDGKIEQINSAGLKILETSTHSSIVGHSIYGVMAAEYHEAYRRLTNKVFKGGIGFMEFELVTFKGRRCWLETNTVPLYDENGRVYSLLAITRNIDRQKRLTQQLEEQRNRLNTIIDSEPECVKLHDSAGIILEMNPAGLSLLNADSLGSVIGHSVYEFVCEEYVDRYRTLSECVFNGVPDSMEFEVDTVTGGRRWLETHAAPLLDAEGRVISLLAITRDIDERKSNELKLHNQQQELAHMCRLHTLGELASGLAHELNQPLCAISSYAESAVLLNRVDSSKELSKVNGILSKIVDESTRASGIIKGLRDFVRKTIPKPQAVDIKHLLNEVFNLLESERRRCGAEMNLILPAELSAAWVDRVQTQQILLNIISNALQAIDESPDISRKLVVSVSVNHDQLNISVRDFAQGISEQVRPHLFTPFFTTKPQGIGIGLSLSRGIAEAQGGQLSYMPAEPPELGGNNAGVNPVELVLAALGTCQEIMYSAYASVMDIPLDAVSVNVRGYLDLQGMFGMDESVPSGYERITFEANIESSADDESLRKLVETVESHCPVLDILCRAQNISGVAKVHGREIHSLQSKAA